VTWSFWVATLPGVSSALARPRVGLGGFEKIQILYALIYNLIPSYLYYSSFSIDI